MASVNAVGNTLTGASGTGTFIGSTSPDITTPTIIGVTDASTADAGDVGEVISSIVLNASSVSCTNGAAKDVTSISLSAGDWDVWGNTECCNSGGGSSSIFTWVSTTSATAPDNAYYARVHIGSGNIVCVGQRAPMRRYTVSGTTTVYLSVLANFASGTVQANGGIYARRVR